jgi:hypothetical protein
VLSEQLHREEAQLKLANGRHQDRHDDYTDVDGISCLTESEPVISGRIKARHSLRVMSTLEERSADVGIEPIVAPQQQLKRPSLALSHVSSVYSEYDLADPSEDH